MSPTSKEIEECLHHESEAETSDCTSGHIIRFKKNQVFDSSEIGYENSSVLFEMNLKNFPLYTITEDCESSVFSFDIHSSSNDSVYVVVRDDKSSMEAVSWTVKYAVTSSNVVHLVHVFPVMKLIPSPMGKFPRRHVNPEYVNLNLIQEEGKRKLLLRRFIDLCVASEFKVDIILIEDDNVAKVIVELVRNLNITKLVIGTTKSSLSGKRRQNDVATKVLKNVQESCDVKIVCEGKVVNDQIIGCASINSTGNINSISSPEDCNFNDNVYVVVRDDKPSMEALSWTVKHAVTGSTTVYLVHVFPVMKLIPSPMGIGKLPRRHVCAEYLTREKGKRKLRLQKFIDLCVALKVKVEIKLIEGDNVAKAIVELVANLNITKLVIGTTESNLRRQNAMAAEVQKKAQESCEVKIICDGKEVIDHINGRASIPSSHTVNSKSPHDQKANKVGGFVPFMRFMPNL